MWFIIKDISEKVSKEAIFPGLSAEHVLESHIDDNVLDICHTCSTVSDLVCIHLGHGTNVLTH